MPPVPDDSTGHAVSDQEPDYRFTLANERTFLAWIRTALALTAGAIAVVHLVPGLGNSVLGRSFAVSLAVAGGLVPVLALLRWRSVQQAMRRDADLQITRLPQLLAAGLFAAGVATTVLLLVPPAA